MSAEARILGEGALSVLETRGWIQGKLQSSRTSGVCLVGAINTAGRGTVWGQVYDLAGGQELYDALLKVICADGNIMNVPTWNDHVATSVEDVKLLVKKAIGELHE